MFELIRNKMRDFLGIETKGSGSYSFQQWPIWGRFEKVKEGDYASMVESVIGWVYACINVLAFNVAKVPFYVYKHTGKEDTLIEEHPFYDLIKKPNEHMLEWELKFLLQAFLDGTGNSYIYHPLTGVKRPGALYILESHLVNPRIVKGVFYYDYMHGGEMRTFTEEEILHFKYPNVQNMFKGMGPLEAARMGINLDAYMSQYQLSLLANRARPDGLLTTEESVSDVEATRVGKKWKKRYGGPDKAGNIAVLGKGLTYQTVALSNKDLEFIASREFNKNEIAGIFNVPPFKLGKVEDVNRANAHALEHSFQKDTIQPRLILRDAFFTKLVQLYDKRLIVRSDNVVPKDMEFQLKQEDQDIQNGVMTINEIRIKRGLNEVAWGKVPYLPFNLMPVGSVKPEKEEPKKGWKIGQIYWEGTKEDARKLWKETYWKGYIRKTQGEERLMISKLHDYFEKQKKRVLANLKKYKKDYKVVTSFFLFDMNEWNDTLISILAPLVRASVLSGGETLIEDFGLDVTFDISSPFVSDFFKMRENKIKHINRETFDKLTKALEDGIAEGETIKQLAGRVEGVYSDAEGYRSRLIARTETNIANNFGHMESMRIANIEKKEWTTAMDEDVRLSHELNELQGCIGLYETFHGTGESYPGEPNCRCVVIPCMEK